MESHPSKIRRVGTGAIQMKIISQCCEWAKWGVDWGLFSRPS